MPSIFVLFILFPMTMSAQQTHDSYSGLFVDLSFCKCPPLLCSLAHPIYYLNTIEYSSSLRPNDELENWKLETKSCRPLLPRFSRIIRLSNQLATAVHVEGGQRHP